MPFDRPTLSTIVSRIESDIETRLPDVGTLLRRSVLKVLARVLAGAIHLLYGFLDFQSQQLFATTADAEGLDMIGTEYGITRTAGSKAQGTVTASGTVGSLIPEGTLLQSSLETIYIVDQDTYIASGGTAEISFTAQDIGADGNEDSGTVLTFVSTISGVNSQATVTSSGITGGSDEELDDDYRERVLTRRRYPPHGGTEADYITWAKEVSGVTRAWSIPTIYGVGTVGVAFTRDNDPTIYPNAAQRATVRNYIISHTDSATGEVVGAPVTAEPGLFILDISALTVNLIIQLYPNTIAIRTAVQEEIESFLYSEGGPGEIIYLSRLSEAISGAVGEIRHRIVLPVDDIIVAYNEVAELGTITWSDYV